MAIQFIVSKTYTVVLETFDGQRYGLLSVAVYAYSREEAESEAVKQATDDGWQRVTVQMTLP